MAAFDNERHNVCQKQYLHYRSFAASSLNTDRQFIKPIKKKTTKKKLVTQKEGGKSGRRYLQYFKRVYDAELIRVIDGWID